MLILPDRTLYNRRIPKNKFYRMIDVDSRLESQFVNEVESILWKHKLSPGTTNLGSTSDIQEIQVFEITLKQENLSREVLENIDRVIPYPILFVLIYRERIMLSMAYKERNKTDENRMVIKDYYSTQWLNPQELQLDILSGLTLKDVYDNILKQLLPIVGKMEEDLEELIEFSQRVEHLEKEIGSLEKRMGREKQFNKKVDLNIRIQGLQKELEELKNKRG